MAFGIGDCTKSQRFLMAARIVWAPTLSDTSAVVKLTISNHPSVCDERILLNGAISL